MSGGRQRAPIVIVDNLLSATDIRSETTTLLTLLPAIDGDNLNVIKWMAARRLLHNSFNCPVCDVPCRFIRYSQGVDGWRWRCNAHKFTKSVRADSFFEKSHISLRKLVILMYMWAYDFPQHHIQRETDLANQTIVDWCTFHREVCERFLEEHPQELGGFHSNGEPVIVEIDETKYFHRKYQRGEWSDGHWVFGAIERHSGRCLAIEVPDQRRETLIPIIRRWILPGSRIVSDGWAAYARIEEEKLYQYDVCVNERNNNNNTSMTSSIDQDSSSSIIHTQNIENTWVRAKRKLRRQHGTSSNLLPSYLNEFLWRNRFQHGNIFGDFIVCVIEQYRGQGELSPLRSSKKASLEDHSYVGGKGDN